MTFGDSPRTRRVMRLYGVFFSWFLIWIVIETEGKGYNRISTWRDYVVEAESKADCLIKLDALNRTLRWKNYMTRCEYR